MIDAGVSHLITIVVRMIKASMSATSRILYETLNVIKAATLNHRRISQQNARGNFTFGKCLDVCLNINYFLASSNIIKNPGGVNYTISQKRVSYNYFF